MSWRDCGFEEEEDEKNTLLPLLQWIEHVGIEPDASRGAATIQTDMQDMSKQTSDSGG